MCSSVAMLAAVAQITNGFFFAGRPYEFSKPICPEANILMAGRVEHDSAGHRTQTDAVSYTFSLGAAYDGKFKVYNMAFADRKLRHENLYWLAEVGGERAMCWDTAIGPSRPVGWIDVSLASENAQYVSYIPDPVGGDGAYVRTPAYFSNLDSTEGLISVLNSVTNLYSSKIPRQMLKNEYDTADVDQYDTIQEFLRVEEGFTTNSAPTYLPRRGSCLTSEPFTLAATNLSVITNGSVFIPIERLADVVCTTGNWMRIIADETKNSADDTFFTRVTYGDAYFPSNAYQKMSWPTDDPDHPDERLNICTTTNDPRTAYVTNATILSVITPQSPKSYRDYSIEYSSTEERWTAWAVTKYLAPFYALMDNDRKVITTNRQDYVVINTDSGGRMENVSCDVLSYSALTRGPSMEAKTICELVVPGKVVPGMEPIPPLLYFRTNTYTLAVSRATGVDEEISIKRDTGSVKFLFFVLDLEFDYNLSYAGWFDWTPSGGHPPTTASGYGKRKMFPWVVATMAPNSSEGKFHMDGRDLFASAKDILLDYVYGKVQGSNFSEPEGPDTKPPYLPDSVIGQPVVVKYSANQQVYVNFSIKNMFAATNLDFTQGTGHPIIYHVPGYKHLDGLPPLFDADHHNGWIGPFYLDEEHKDEYRSMVVQLFSDLISEQPNVPESVIWDLYNYELVMRPDLSPFMGVRPTTHMVVEP